MKNLAILMISENALTVSHVFYFLTLLSAIVILVWLGNKYDMIRRGKINTKNFEQCEFLWSSLEDYYWDLQSTLKYLAQVGVPESTISKFNIWLEKIRPRKFDNKLIYFSSLQMNDTLWHKKRVKKKLQLFYNNLQKAVAIYKEAKKESNAILNPPVVSWKPESEHRFEVEIQLPEGVVFSSNV